MSFKSEDIGEDIQKSRPNLKPNTIKQYESNLKKLKKLFDSDNYNVMEKISHLHYTSQRNHLNAIIVLLNALNSDDKNKDLITEYGEIRDKLNDKYDEDQKSGVISDKQSKNFATMDEMNEMLNKMKEDLKPIRKKDNLTAKEKTLLTVFTMFSILTKYPMRNDLSGMEVLRKGQYNKLNDDDKKKTNYLVIDKNKMFFSLNEYKTSKKFKNIHIEIEDKEVKKLLRFYIRVMLNNEMGILFKSSTGLPITRNALSQLLIKFSKKYMNKGISSTLIRKIYMSSKYSDIKEELEKDNKMMGHSTEVALDTYVKKAQD
jgi:hypothetical protein